MNSVNSIHAGVRAAGASGSPCANTFWDWMDSHNRAKPAAAEFARVFRARPRYRYRVSESPSATGDGLVA
jgi:hypothetical protein